MGRVMKRVPLDFDWPKGHVWKGYLNPFHGVPCPYCHDNGDNSSRGYTKEALEYEKTWYGYKNGWSYIPNPHNPSMRYCPQAKPYAMERWEYDFIVNHDGRLRNQLFRCDKDAVPPYEELKDWLLRNGVSLFIDAIFIWMMREEYCRRNGFESTCPHCGGDGTVWINDEVRRMHDKWTQEEPPSGDGYQLWETTSEGSPMSPVFSTFEELCEWCAENATTFADFKATKEEWAEKLRED